MKNKHNHREGYFKMENIQGTLVNVSKISYFTKIHEKESIDLKNSVDGITSFETEYYFLIIIDSETITMNNKDKDALIETWDSFDNAIRTWYRIPEKE